MAWLQLNFHINPQQADAFETALLAAGAVSVTYQDQADEPILEPALGETPLWTATKITGLFDAEINTRAASLIFLAQLNQALGAATQISDTELPEPRWEQLEDRDWQRQWMDNYHPIDCGHDLWICPSWTPPPAPQATNVMLDPGLAFGTGTHPTTLLCLRWLAAQELQDRRIIDYGCGSGILAIAALLRGARHGVGIDIDPQALLATRDNAQRNGLEPEALTTYLPQAVLSDGQLKPELPFQPADLVLANILAGPLVELAPALSQLTANGGKLCLSGVLASQAQTVMSAYREFDFEPPEVSGEWAQLAAIKRG